MKHILVSAAALALLSCNPSRDQATANEALSEGAGRITESPARSDPALPVPPGSGTIVPAQPAAPAEPGNGMTGSPGATNQPVHEGSEKAVIPLALQGRWGMGAADCDPKRSDNKGLIRIDAESLRFYESRAMLVSPQVVEQDKLVGRFRFTGEGQTWEKVQTLTVKGDTLTRSEEEGSFTYKRCT